MKTFMVLDSPLRATTYAELAECCQRWARGPRPVAIEFANTQIVTLMRHDPSFRRLMQVYEHLIPDGMPLVWCLNRAGAGLRDRVYGPTFMRYFLEHCPAGFTHYLLGGSAACGARLREVFLARNPRLQFVGGFHGACDVSGRLAPEAEESVLAELQRVQPDFLWVGFGTPKQQAWTARYKDRLPRGVVLTVGFAFDVNAGLKPDAPPWMQRLGLTWLFRLVSEPARLGPRYLRYNSLFLYHLGRDALRGRAVRALPR